MTKNSPDHHDAQLVLEMYDLRREPVMRESRESINRDFWPRNESEALAVLQPEHPLNRPYRQVATYWEMVYGMAKHGVVHTDFLLDNNAEGLFLFARIEPYLTAVRAASSPRAFQKAEWIAGSTDMGKTLLDMFRSRVKKKLAAPVK